MKSRVLLPLLSRDSVKLGRLTTDIKNPQFDHLDPDHPISTLPPFDYKGFDEDDFGGKSRGCAAILTSLFKISGLSDDDSNFSLRSVKCRTYMMDNSSPWFKNACAIRETQDWLDERIEDSLDVYLIVGYQTMLNAKLSKHDSKTRQFEAAARVPVGEALTHGAGTVTPASKALDIGLSGHSGSKDSNRIALTGVGEQLYAVQYCKVEFDFDSSGKRMTQKLDQKHQWLRSKDIRGGDDDDSGVDDIVIAELTDDLKLGPDWSLTTEENGDGEVVYFYEASTYDVDERE